MRVLITRPREDGLVTAQALHQHGIRSVLEPLLKIIYNQSTPTVHTPYQAIIFTTRHAVKAFGYRFPDIVAPCYCSGDGTAALAADYGLEPLVAIEGDGRALLERLQNDLVPAKGPLFRVIAEGDDDPLSQELAHSGFKVQQVPLYHIQPVQDISRSTLHLFEQHSIDGIMFHSPRVARHFALLAQQAPALKQVTRMAAWCINDLTADELKDLPFAHIAIATQPTQQQLIQLIIEDRALFDGERQ